MPSKKKPVYTVPTEKGWANKQGGKTTSAHREKDAATAVGRQQAKSDKTKHRAHNKDGKIGRSNSYGNDPNPPKDKNR